MFRERNYTLHGVVRKKTQLPPIPHPHIAILTRGRHRCSVQLSTHIAPLRGDMSDDTAAHLRVRQRRPGEAAATRVKRQFVSEIGQPLAGIAQLDLPGP